MASSTIGKPSKPPETDTADPQIDGVTLQTDGSAVLSNGLVLSDAGVLSLLHQLAGQKKIVILPSPEDGLTLFSFGIHGLVTSVNTRKYTLAPDFLGQVHRGLHDVFGIGTPNMSMPAKVPAQDGLVQAGTSAVTVLRQFPNPAYNALVRLDVDQLGSHTESLGLHIQLAEVYSAAANRVNLGVGYLSGLVWDGSHLVYNAIQEALPIDEDLTKAAKPMTTYFDEPVEQAQKTKRLLKKAKDKATSDATSTVKDQAVQQAKAELQSEINAKVGPIFSGNNGNGSGNNRGDNSNT